MATSTWSNPSAVSTILSTEMNSIAAGNSTAASSEIDNTTSRNLYMQLELYLAGINTSAETNPGVDIYMVVSHDGTTFEDADEVGTYVLTIPYAPGAASAVVKKKLSGLIQIPPNKFKLFAKNSNSSVAWAASGNTIKYRTFSYAAS